MILRLHLIKFDSKNSAWLVHSKALILTDLYPAAYEDWVDPRCIQGIIVVIHAEIGELTRGDQSHKELLNDAVFFYNASYIPRSSRSNFGHLEPIMLPPFDSPEWPLPDMHTTESFRAKLRFDFQNIMKPNLSSKQSRLSWFMPIGVFVDLFSVAEDIHKTPNFFVFRHMTDDLCSSLMDRGWDCKITVGGDVIKCIIPQSSLLFRYHIGKSTLYALFVYNRHKMLSNSTWEAIDQYEPIVMVSILCEMGEWTQDVEVGMSWTFSDIRQEVLLQRGEDTNHTEADIFIRSGDTLQKINPRQERQFTSVDAMPPKAFRLVARS